MNTNDRRVKRTKKLLKESLARLLFEKDLRSISIKELTDMADISRGAFYTHYQDIYDLYEQMENELIEDINHIIVKDPSDRYEIVYEKVIDYVHDNADICCIFMSTGGYKDKFTSYLEERFNEIVQYEMKANTLKEDWKYLIRYQNDGFVAVLRLWLDSDFSLPKEKLLRMIINIDDVMDPLFK